MQENNTTEKKMPAQDAGGNQSPVVSQQNTTVLTTKDTKQHKVAVAEEVHETFKDENTPAEFALGDDGQEVGGEGG